MDRPRPLDPPAADLRRALREKYRAVAARPSGHFPYPVGTAGMRALGYDPARVDALPRAVAERFVGVGNPLAVQAPRPGARVLDAGCGSGADAFLARDLAGAGGRVVGLDLVGEMLAPARAALAAAPRPGLRFVRGSIESLPFPDGAFDLLLSNGALNLVPDKGAAFRELRRVLAPGGVLAAADLLAVEAVPGDLHADPASWAT